MLPELSDTLARLLDLITARKGDDWGDECCLYCYDDDWHSDRRYRPEGGGAAGDAIWHPWVPKCQCPCHDARRALGREDRIYDPRWQAPEA